MGRLVPPTRGVDRPHVRLHGIGEALPRLPRGAGAWGLQALQLGEVCAVALKGRTKRRDRFPARRPVPWRAAAQARPRRRVSPEAAGPRPTPLGVPLATNAVSAGRVHATVRAARANRRARSGSVRSRDRATGPASVATKTPSSAWISVRKRSLCASGRAGKSSSTSAAVTRRTAGRGHSPSCQDDVPGCSQSSERSPRAGLSPLMRGPRAWRRCWRSTPARPARVSWRDGSPGDGPPHTPASSNPGCARAHAARPRRGAYTSAGGSAGASEIASPRRGPHTRRRSAPVSVGRPRQA
jgi:hypothetical protein